MSVSVFTASTHTVQSSVTVHSAGPVEGAVFSVHSTLYPVFIFEKPCNRKRKKKNCRCCKTSCCRQHHGNGTACQITGQVTNACIAFTCDPAGAANTTVSLCQSGSQQALADGEETLGQFKSSPFPVLSQGCFLSSLSQTDENTTIQSLLHLRPHTIPPPPLLYFSLRSLPAPH